MISIQNVSYRYTDHDVLKNITLDIKQGTLVSLVGKSGCGKSTLLKLIAGLQKPGTGTVRINNEVLEGVRPKTAILFQDVGLFPWKTVLENITFILKDRGMENEDARRCALENLKLVEMDTYCDRYPNSLSGGQKQRVAFAKAISLNPDVLLLDEATASLDAFSSETVQDILKMIHQTKNITMVVVTHKIDEAVYLGDSVVVMKDGQITEVFENETKGLMNQRSQVAFFDLCNKVKEAIQDEKMG